ncbi:MAG TPA: rhodanese-like domain-containing protein [Chloroflexota bacterium]|nr:rhodanese-like domain-containing protein [Chloroflexota bacterium]
MYFKQIVHDDLGCASYVIGSSVTAQCAVVDPRWEIEPYLEIAVQQGFRITHIIETHNHADHVSGHGRLARATGAQIDIYEEAGVDYLHHPLKDNETIDLGDVRLHVVHTPGHRPEHIALAVEDASRGGEPWMVLTGDSLFVGDVARPDLAIDGKEGAARLYHSLHERLLRLPEYVEVYPGHVSGSLCGRVTSSVNSTTVGYEKRFNEALRRSERDAFIRFMNENLPERPPNMAKIVEANRGPLLMKLTLPSYLGADTVARQKTDGAVMLDVRSPDAFLSEHIPGSIHVALTGKQFGTRVGFIVPVDVPLMLITEDEAQAQKAADALQVVAYDSVIGYSTVASWKAAGNPVASTDTISPQSLYDQLSEAEALNVLDVREPSEWAEGHIEGAAFVPYRELPARLSEVPAGRVAVICDAGHRSVIAASLLERAGLTEVSNVDQGMSGWRKAGLPEVSGARHRVESVIERISMA